VSSGGSLPPQRRSLKDVLVARYTDSRGKKVVRPGSPVLFLIAMVCIFWIGYRTSHIDCVREQQVSGVVERLATVYQANARRAIRRSRIDSGAQRTLDLEAYRDDQTEANEVPLRRTDLAADGAGHLLGERPARDVPRDRRPGV
jgi:hypothetical protein